MLLECEFCGDQVADDLDLTGWLSFDGPACDCGMSYWHVVQFERDELRALITVLDDARRIAEQMGRLRTGQSVFYLPLYRDTLDIQFIRALSALFEHIYLGVRFNIETRDRSTLVTELQILNSARVFSPVQMALGQYGGVNPSRTDISDEYGFDKGAISFLKLEAEALPNRKPNGALKRIINEIGRVHRQRL